MNQTQSRPSGAQPSRLRSVFMGTPDFAVPSLRRLLEASQVVGVFTQPDRPAGRGRKLRPSPIKVLALEAGIPVFQPKSLKREPEVIEALKELKPDVIVVAAYGLILPASVLNAAPLGALNVHASLLPRWRGAAPVTHAILAGDAQTGVCIMKMDEGLDTGDVLSRSALPITPEHTAGDLTGTLAEMGAELLVNTLPDWAAGKIKPQPQDDDLSTYAPRLKKADGRLDWHEPAEALARRVRAMSPWPGAHTQSEEGMLKIHAAELALDLAEAGNYEAAAALDASLESSGRSVPEKQGKPGSVRADENGFPIITTGAGQLRLLKVQAAGGRAMPARDFLRGRQELIGTRLGNLDDAENVSAATETIGSGR